MPNLALAFAFRQHLLPQGMNPAYLAVVAALCGCAAAPPTLIPPTLTLSVQGVAGELAYGAPTLADARRRFFGDDTGSGGGGGGGGGSGLLSGADPVTLQGLPPTVTALTLQRRDDLGGVTLTSSLQAGYHHMRGTLPQGIGVLTDPLQIEIRGQSLAAQVVASRTAALPYGLRLDYGAGIGLVQVSAAMRLQSALLDLRGRSHQTLPYAMVQARLTGSTGPDRFMREPSGLGLLAEVLHFQSGATEARLGVAQSF